MPFFSSIGNGIKKATQAVGRAASWTGNNVLKPAAAVALPLISTGLSFVPGMPAGVSKALDLASGFVTGLGSPTSPVQAGGNALGSLSAGPFAGAVAAGLGALGAALSPPDDSDAGAAVTGFRAGEAGMSVSSFAAASKKKKGFLGIGDGKPGVFGIGDGKKGTWGIGDGKPGVFGIGTGRHKARKIAEAAARAAGKSKEQIKAAGDAAAAAVGEDDEPSGSLVPWLIGGALLLFGL